MTDYSTGHQNERIGEVAKASKEEYKQFLQDIRRRRAKHLAQKQNLKTTPDQ